MLPRTQIVLNAKFSKTVMYHLESSKEIQIADLNFTTELWAMMKARFTSVDKSTCTACFIIQRKKKTVSRPRISDSTMTQERYVTILADIILPFISEAKLYQHDSAI